MTYENLLIEKDGRITTIVVNRPDKLNALNDAVVLEIGAAMDEAGADPRSWPARTSASSPRWTWSAERRSPSGVRPC